MVGRIVLAWAIANGAAQIAAGQDWHTYQADARHTGYVPVALDPQSFQVRWTHNFGNKALNPVTAAEGKVFTSLQYGGRSSTWKLAWRIESQL